MSNSENVFPLGANSINEDQSNEVAVSLEDSETGDIQAPNPAFNPVYSESLAPIAAQSLIINFNNYIDIDNDNALYDTAPKKEEEGQKGTDAVGFNVRDKSENDKLAMVGVSLLTNYRDAAKGIAKENGMKYAEFVRRAILLAMNDPARLSETDELEQAYIEQLGSSRHHKPEP